MLRLLVVEDEDYMRRTIVNCIDWASIGFVVQEAADGEIALEKIERFQPHAVITDIRMPIVDGLELTQRLLKTNPEITVVIISGHDEFKYAQKAVQLGVWEFLQKPILPTDFTATMKRLHSYLIETEEQRENIRTLKLQLHQSLPLLEFQFLNRLMTEAVDSKVIHEKEELFGINLKASQYAVVLFSGTDKDSVNEGEDPLIQFALRNVIKEEIGNRGHCFEDSSGRLVLLFLIKDRTIEDRDFIFALVDSLKRSNQYALDFTITASIGATVDQLQELPFSYETAVSALDQRIIRGNDSIYDYQDFAHLEIEDYQFYSQIEQIILAFHFQSNEELVTLFKKLNESILLQTLRVSPTSVRIALIDLVNGVHKVLLESDCIPEKSSAEIYNSILNLDSFDDLSRALEDYLLKSKDILNKSQQKRTTSLVQGVCYYIQQNFQDPELSLNQAAEKAYISAVYLSTLFKKEIGITFVDYVTQTRLEEAKKHLASGKYKNYEIAVLVGYNDPQYFSNCFKRYTGMTPSQYRVKKEP